MKMLKNALIALSLVAFAGAANATDAPKKAAKPACVADATHKCTVKHKKAK